MSTNRASNQRPHAATLPRDHAAQPKLAKDEPGPHPATVLREKAVQAKVEKAGPGPHAATVERGKAVQGFFKQKDVSRHPNMVAQHTSTRSAPTMALTGRLKYDVIQCYQDLTDAEWSGQATTLAAELSSPAGYWDLGKFHSAGGNHAEDNLIAALPPAGIPVGHYQLLIVINRSPCTAISGAQKHNGHLPCMERLIGLQQFGIGGYTFQLTIIYRHLYGHSNWERALNALGVRQGSAAGIMFGHGEGYYDVGVMSLISQLES